VKNPKIKQSGGQTVFSDQEENELNVIQVCGDFGQPLTKMDARVIAGNMLQIMNRKFNSINTISQNKHGLTNV